MISWNRSCDARPAEWAVGVGLKPSIDAVYMEDMEAIRQQLNPLFVMESIQADSALSNAVSFFPIPKGWDCLNCRFIEAESFGCVGEGHEWASPPAASSGPGEPADDVGAVPVQAALYDEDVVAEEEDGSGDDSDNGDGQDGEAGE